MYTLIYIYIHEINKLNNIKIFIFTGIFLLLTVHVLSIIINYYKYYVLYKTNFYISDRFVRVQ